MVQAEVEQSK